jgi:hypothetical protein
MAAAGIATRSMAAAGQLTVSFLYTRLCYGYSQLPVAGLVTCPASYRPHSHPRRLGSTGTELRRSPPDLSDFDSSGRYYGKYL